MFHASCFTLKVILISQVAHFKKRIMTRTFDSSINFSSDYLGHINVFFFVFSLLVVSSLH